MAKSYRKFLVGSVATAVVASSFAGVAGAASFSDVPSEATHADAIAALIEAGVIKGFPDGTFKPGAQIKRGDAAVMVARALGILDGKIPATTLTDLNKSNPETREAVAKLAAAGHVSGFEDGSFRPNDSITRAQMAKYVANAFGLPVADGITKFTDVNKNSELAKYVDALADAGITEGKADGTFGYGDLLKRNDFSAMVYRALNADKTPASKPVKITAADDKGNKLTNGDQKRYTVKITNPNAPDKAVAGVKVNITFKENIKTNGKPQNNIYVTNNDNSTTVPYQSNDATQQVVQVTTNHAGEATFTISGANGTVTPIAFLDGSNQEWDTEGGIKFGTQDGRFDSKYEYYDQFESVTFANVEYEIDVVGKRDKFAAIGEDNGREYNITVKDKDGNPYRGFVNVGVEELEDRDGTNDLTDAYIVGSKRGESIEVRTDNDGKAKFRIVSPTENDMATPVVWIDHSYSDNPQGKGILDDNDSRSYDVEYTNFQKPYVDNGSEGAELKLRDLKAGGVGFNLSLLNQSGEPFLPSWGTKDDLDARVTFTIKNDGPSVAFINTKHLGDVKATAGRDYSKNPNSGVFSIQSGGQITIAGDITDNEWIKGDDADYLVQVWSIDGDAKVTVSASAVVDSKVDPRSQSVSVYAGPITKVITGEGKLGGTKVVDVTTKDSADVGRDADQIILTFDEEVSGFEKADFRVLTDDGVYIAPSSVVYDVEELDTEKAVKKKLVLQFTDETVEDAYKIEYNGENGDAAVVLIDKFGSVVRAFSEEVN